MERSTDKTYYIFASGAKLGLALVAFYTIMYLTGQLIESSLTSLSWLIYIAVIYLTMKAFRDNYNEGFLSYGQGVMFGLKISILSGIFVGLFYFILMSFIDPEFREQMIAVAEEAALAMGLPESQVEELRPSFEMTTNPWLMLVSNMLSGLFTGTLISLFIAAFVKRKGDPFQDAMKNVE
mgnify:CR=1 FL=1